VRRPARARRFLRGLGAAGLVLVAVSAVGSPAALAQEGQLKAAAGTGMAPSRAGSWSASPDGLIHDFVLRKGVRFHNGKPVTADDVKFSLERGALQGREAEGEVRASPCWQPNRDAGPVTSNARRYD
jgi:ABC-type transport system substrate-binding protein